MLLNMLPELCQHFKKTNMSRLAVILGIFQIKVQGFKIVNLLVMKNSIQARGKVIFRFDLKGSKYQRRVMQPGVSKKQTRKVGDSVVLKDIDLDNLLNQDPLLVNMRLEDRRNLMRQLKKDVEFLKSKNLMDYSLLLAVEQISFFKSIISAKEDKNLFEQLTK